MKWTTAMLTGAAIIAAACTDGAITTPPPPPPPPQPPPGALVIRSERDTSLTSDTLAVGGNVWLRVIGVDTAAAIDWTVNDTAVMHVAERHNARVHLNAHKAGGATIGGSLDGRSGTFVLVVLPPSATNHPPVARIQGPTSINEGSAVTFDGRTSSDPDHDALTYLWSFGDGTAHDTANAATHTYADNGSRTVTLIVTDPSGAADTASMSIAVKNVAPVISALAVPSAPVNLGDSVKVTATVSDPGTADVLTITFDWGDGKTSSGSDTHGAHVYSAAAGTYTIKATVRDDDGDSASRTASVAVVNAQHVNGYEAIDLGTLGGNSATVKDINDYGKIVGSSLTASGAQHAYVWENGVMRDISVAGYEGSEAQRVNNAGVIAGVVWTGPDENCPHNWTGVVWRNGTGTVLSRRPPTGYPVTAVAIDEAADVVWSACAHETSYAYLSQGDHWQSLGGEAGNPAGGGGFPVAIASGMNERPQIVGEYGAVYGGDSPYPSHHAFLWENGSMRDLGTLGFKPCYATANNCAWSRATSINENGQVAGFSMDAAGTWHAVLWDNAGVHDLWTMTYDGYEAGAVINDGGQIAASSGGEGFFWSGGTRYPLGSLGGGGVNVIDMNEAGAVAGTSLTASGEQHAFVWTRDRGMVDLGTGPDGFTGAWVVGITFHGDIAGYTAPCNRASDGRCNPPPTGTRAVLWRKSQ